MGHLQETLFNSGFVDPDAPGHTLTRLRRLLARHQLDETEVQILRGVLRHLNLGLDGKNNANPDPNVGIQARPLALV